jgi:phage gp36-like protein
MTYVTNSDIESRLGAEAYVQLTDDEGTGSPDLARVDEARLGAEGETNSYLATRYAVPVNLTAEGELASVLKSFVLDLVSYRLHSRRPPVPADIVRHREEAIAWLSRVASGLVQLPSATQVAGNTALGIGAESAGPARTMTRSSLENL